MGSGSSTSTKWAPKYRCYNSAGTSLYNGNLVLGDGTGASGTWDIGITGNAATASALSNIASDQSATSVSAALQAFWNAKKDSLPRDKLISFTSSHSGRAMHMGYFINGYDTSPYGGFFTAFYGTPYYSCASNGTFSCYELVRADSRSYSIDISGNAATATRIKGNLTGATDNTNCNIWISDGTPTGVPRYASGFYYNPSSKIFTVPGAITAQYAGALSITINNSTQGHSI
jgi:hypothetical protein